MGYSFHGETSEEERKERDKNRDVFLEAVCVKFEQLAPDEQKLVNRFAYHNLHNISWYTTRLKREKRFKNFYVLLTLVLVVGLPVLMYFGTLGRNHLPESIVTLVSSIFALHKFVSEWIDRRMYESLFHEAKVDLLNVLYRIQNDFEGRGSVHSGHGISKNGGILAFPFEEALKYGIEESRAISDAETTSYFELQTRPSFNLQSISTLR